MADTTTTTTRTPSIKVMIVGAGLGGLTLGAILERAGVDYEIFERSATVNPVGSAIALFPSVMPMFKQLGLLEKLTSISKVMSHSLLFKENGDLQVDLDYFTAIEEKYHFKGLIMARPQLYQMLLEQIPPQRISYRKRLLSHQETDEGILIRFGDNSSYTGHVLIGADGANSGVRQVLYKHLDALKVLPKTDKEPLKYSSIALVGQTQVLDPERFTYLKDRFCTYDAVISETGPFVCVAFPTAQNTICWMAIEFLDKESSKIHDNFRNSEWGPEAAAEMAKKEEIRRVIMPSADKATMGELIDLTPKELMSKVMLEEKIFKTWTHGRTGLLGDACHKMSPAAGQGAANAMLDAIVLGNHLESIKTCEVQEIESALLAYRNERYEMAKAAVDGSAMTMTSVTKGMMGNILRKILSNPPQWLWSMIMNKACAYRPQIAFLPRAEDNGSVRPLNQPSLHLATSPRPTVV